MPPDAPGFELSKANAVNISNVITNKSEINICNYTNMSFFTFLIVLVFLCRNFIQRIGMIKRPEPTISRRMLSLC